MRATLALAVWRATTPLAAHTASAKVALIYLHLTAYKRRFSLARLSNACSDFEVNAFTDFGASVSAFGVLFLS